jgi:hypothetical protein
MTMRAGQRLVLGFLVVSGFALPAPPLAGTTVWTIPGTANVAGQNGTRFVSDLAVTNPGTVPTQVTISIIPASGTTPYPVTLNGGETVVWRNVLDRLWGVQVSAATQVTCDVPLVLRARTYNTAASGTYGVALPVFADEDLLSATDVGHSLWVSQSASGSTGYRTNVAVVFPDPSGGEATVTIYDADGNEIGSKDYALTAAGILQFGVGGIAGPVSIGRAEIQVIRGRAAGYSVVVDNVTGDSSLFTFEGLPAGWQDVLINGVARVNGQFSTFFRTDGRFFNPTTEDATVTAAFHDKLNANPAPLTRDFVVPAGKLIDVVDILGTFFSLPEGSAGAVRFRSQTPVGILCRTSNVDPTGTFPGTYGAQQRPTQLLAFLMSADAGAIVTGIRQDASFRTNVGFAAGEDGASYALTLKNAAGATVATATRSLGPFGWEQPGIVALFSGTGIPDDAQLLVKVVSGSVDVFDSSLDNLSGDSIVTRIAPLPAEIPSSATIGPEGGSIRSSDGIFTLKVPAGALTTPTPISIAITTNDAPGALGPGYEVLPGGLEFAKPALLRLRYGAGGLAVGEIGRVSLGVLTGAGWAGLTGGRVDIPSRALLIKLWNTSPSASLVAARTPQAATSVSRFGTLLALEVIARDPLPPGGSRGEWLPTEGENELEAFFRVTPSSAGQEGRLIRPSERQTVTVTWFPPSMGWYTSISGTKALYRAPRFIPGAFVVDTMRVRFYDAMTREVQEINYSLKIIRRAWFLLVDFKYEHTCNGAAVSSSVYTRTRRHDFRFNDNMQLNSSPAQLDSINVDISSGACAPCTLGSQGTVGDLEFINPFAVFNTFGDVLGEPKFLLLGQVVVRRGLRAVAVTCPAPYSNPAADFTFTLPIPDVGFWPLSNESLFSGDRLPTDLWYLTGIWSWSL